MQDLKFIALLTILIVSSYFYYKCETKKKRKIMKEMNM